MPTNFIEPNAAVKKLSATPLKHDAVRKRRKTGRGKMSAQIERPPPLASESRAVVEVMVVEDGDLSGTPAVLHEVLKDPELDKPG